MMKKFQSKNIDRFSIDDNEDEEEEAKDDDIEDNNNKESISKKPVITINLDDYEDNDISIEDINEPNLRQSNNNLIIFWNNYYALILVFLSGLGFSIQTMFVKLMSNSISKEKGKSDDISGEFSFEFCFYRGLLQFVLSLSIIKYSNNNRNNNNPIVPIFGNDWWITYILILRSFLGFGGVIFAFLSVECLPVGDSTTLVMLSPLFATLFSFCILKEPLNMSFIIASILSLVGLVLIAQPESIFGNDSPSKNPNLLLGIAFALCGALSAGGAYVCVRMLGLSGIPWFNVTFVQSLGQIFLVFPAMYIYSHGKQIGWENQNVTMILLGGSIGAVSQAAMTVGMQRESSARATSMRMSDVLFGYIFQFFLTKNDKLTVTSLFGAILITSSIIIIMYFKPQKSNSSSSNSNSNNSSNTTINNNDNNSNKNENNQNNNTSKNIITDTENPIIEMMIKPKKIKYTSLQQNEDDDKEFEN